MVMWITHAHQGGESADSHSGHWRQGIGGQDCLPTEVYWEEEEEEEVHVLSRECRCESLV